MLALDFPRSRAKTFAAVLERARRVFGPDFCMNGYVVKPNALEGLYEREGEGSDLSVLRGPVIES